MEICTAGKEQENKVNGEVSVTPKAFHIHVKAMLMYSSSGDNKKLKEKGDVRLRWKWDGFFRDIEWKVLLEIHHFASYKLFWQNA